MFWIKDITGNAEDGIITLARNASENIEGTGASYVLDRDHGYWQVTSDGTDWWILANIDPFIGYAKETIVELTASQTIPASNNFGNIGLEAGATSTSKTYITRGAGTVINFNVAGRYRADFNLKNLNPTADTELKLEVYNNTTAASHISEIGIAVDSAADIAVFTPMSFTITTANTAQDFLLRWATGDAATIACAGGKVFIYYLGKA
jgi:hypothetical protein